MVVQFPAQPLLQLKVSYTKDATTITASSDISKSRQCTWRPDHNDNDHDQCQNQASDARIKVRAVDRKQLPTDVGHHVEECRGEDTFASVVVEPNDDHTLGHRIE